MLECERPMLVNEVGEGETARPGRWWWSSINSRMRAASTLTDGILPSVFFRGSWSHAVQAADFATDSPLADDL